ncbi:MULTISPECIES: hypothetical protein [unclassified Nocardioides]|uniref:hypothetical protein n=1 Tax=unclassified Nocardioides TaxID=2615069 RepID=UPI0006FA3513|nr:MULTISPECIES: hypothetical protein [unclassified Nocardioides]KQY51661.1 hypothetical protein ASD30_20055 [Nocardioides sp. Root140]KRF10937.1 hypothetical protein ASH02_19035 [Nocardioides sp. Soil796]
MNGTAGPLLRRVRGAVLAFVALSTGVVAHVAANGLLPSVPTLVAFYLLAAVGLGWFLRRPATTLRIVALTVGGQTVVHAMLTMTSGHAGDAAHTVGTAPVAPARPESLVGSGSPMEQYAAARPQVQSDFALPHAMHHLIADMTGAHAPMMVLHLCAAALVGLWLAVGERAIWTLLALAAAVVVPSLRQLLAGLALPAPLAAAPAAFERSAPPHLTTLARSVVRRGPPALLPA